MLKKQYFTQILWMFLCFASLSSSAQGVRYYDSVFEDANISSRYNQYYMACPTPQFCAFDIHYPNVDPASVRAGIIMIHGGGFVSGDKSDFTVTCKKLAQKGFVVVNLNYQLYSSTDICKSGNIDLNYVNLSLQYVNTACKLLFANAGQYKVDKNNVFIMGASAGAILALSEAYSFPESYYTSNGIKFKAVGAIAGALYNPINLNQGDKTPVVFVHNANDVVVPAYSKYSLGCYNPATTAYSMTGGINLFEKIWGGQTSIPYARAYFDLNSNGHTNFQVCDPFFTDPYAYVTNFFADVYYKKTAALCKKGLDSSAFCPGKVKRYYASAACSTAVSSSRVDGGLEDEDNTGQGEIGLYPNPSAHKTTLTLPNLEGMAELRISDASGQIIKTLTSTNTEIELDLSDMLPGLYFLVVHHNNQSTLKKLQVIP